MSEAEEYIQILKEQLEEKSRLVNVLTELVKQKDQELILAYGTIKELEDK